MWAGVLLAAKAKSSAPAMSHASIAEGNHSAVSFLKKITKYWYLKGLPPSLSSWIPSETCNRYLRNLQKQAYNWQRETAVKRSRKDDLRFEDDLDVGHAVDDFRAAAELLGSRPGESPPSSVTELSCNIWTSPFTLPTTVIKTSHQEQRNWIWLAPSSAWSLTARLTLMMTEKLGLNSDNVPPQFYLDGDIYPFTWNRDINPDPPDTTGLPSLDYALYLFQIVRFHLGQAYRFFDEDTFVVRIHEFYNARSEEKATQPRFWFVQFLMVIALGHAFLSRSRNHKDPPGSRYFARAMSAIPNYTSTGKDSLLAIEALALVGLYLYAIDHREAAHLHVGHAIRIAQMEGMHTQLPEGVLGPATVARCRSLWWSLYTMDRHFSPSVGLPMTTNDSDITTLINPPSPSPKDLAFNLQIRITRMLSFIIGTIYKTEKTQLGTFLEITRNILETMARYAEEIEKMIHVDFNGSMDNLPGETRHTILLYHQCVIVATRPLLLSVLKERLEKLGRAEEDWQKFLALPKSLISIGIKSAEKILLIIGDDNCLLETFLPFELELTYAAALHLTMADALFPSSIDDHSYSQAAHSILDEMIICGNRVAGARKGELGRIEGLFQELSRRVEQEGLRTLTLSDPGLTDTTNISIPEAQPGVIPMMEPDLGLGSSAQEERQFSIGPSGPTIIGSLDSIGISSNEFLSIVDQINNPGIPYGVLDVRPDWLSEEDIADSFV
ncbi:fungal-specific transcription factor domain-containing protein [Penicillium hispanicum]|uniref:fungal-specific transcription factor domain-containing protein n=1 Tax=Penicillium hispanicum TaxID=1080232 RepID=UPI00253FE219|nr:fungal-specific transcription factor domain-containing protein [Penicillium hispanicum]KAJ5585102.1 fungal-specific transcription factor domain-containing protein [Penicillium hispanicum]